MNRIDKPSTEDLLAEADTVLTEADEVLNSGSSVRDPSRPLARVDPEEESRNAGRQTHEGTTSAVTQSQPSTLTGEWIEMRAPRGSRTAALLRYSPQESGRIRKHFEKRQLTEAAAWHGGNLGSTIVDQLASASSLVASGLRAGEMFQVIGPIDAIAGLKDGTLEFAKATGGGLRGWVTKPGGGGIVRHVKLAKASGTLVMAPVLAWQVLHAIAGTTQLREINRRLDVMQRTLESLQARHEATVVGEVIHAVRALDDILQERTNTGTFTRDMETRLSHAEQSIGSILARNRILVEQFRKKTVEGHRLKGKTGAMRAGSILLEEGGTAVSDMKMLAGLAAADLRVGEARLYHAMEHNPADLQRRLDAVTAKVDDYREMLRNLPSVERLESHLQDCVEEMGWWQKKVFARDARKGRNQVSSLQLRDVDIPVRARENPHDSNYVFWRDKSGDTHIHVLPNEGGAE